MPISQQLIDNAVADGIITLDRYLQIPPYERDSMKVLFSGAGRQAVADGIITLDRYLQIPFYERDSMKVLFSGAGRQAVADGIITLDRYLQIPYYDRDSMKVLFSDAGRQAVADGIIALDRYLQIPPYERDSMKVLFSGVGRQAVLKLPIVVQEEARRYMKSLANPNTVEDLQAYTRLISQVKEDGVEVVWDQIKGKVADRMFDEFGSLYRDREDHSFTVLIEAGQDTELPDLSIFQEQVQNSKGYHQFCSQMLRQSGMFFSHKTSAEYLSEHRHDSPEAQREYDQQFGLVLRNP